MKHISPSLLALAVFTAVPSAYGLDVKDDDLKLGLVMRLQIRAERAWSADSTGNPYNVASNLTNSPPDSVDFYLRRFRIGFAGTYQDSYKFKAILRSDSADRTAANDAGRTPAIHQGYIARVFKGDDGSEQTIKAGLDYAWFDNAADIYSSSAQLFPSPRATESGNFMQVRGVGVGYMMRSTVAGHEFIWGADIQNNVGDDATAANTGGASYNQKGEGMAYTTRLQFVPYDSDAKGHMKTVESFVGAPGTGVLIGLEAGVNQRDNTSATARQNMKAEGIEVLFHHDALTALFEYRRVQLVTDASTAAASSDVGRKAIIFQAGYAFPMYDGVMEPAFRWSRIDLDTSTVESTNYAGQDYGTSGFQTELGVNWYINKTHNHKLQVAYQNWRGEQSSVATEEKAAHANILRAQWQLNF